MSAISAAAMRVRTMADGSLRIEVEVEPADAQSAFALFGKPGAPMALAALVTGHAAKSDESAAPPEAPATPKRSAGDGGKPIARWLALRCKEVEFQHWAARQMCLQSGAFDETAVAEWCRETCNVTSRGDIDGNRDAEDLFRKFIQGPWQKHCLARGIGYQQ